MKLLPAAIRIRKPKTTAIMQLALFPTKTQVEVPREIYEKVVVLLTRLLRQHADASAVANRLPECGHE